MKKKNVTQKIAIAIVQSYKISTVRQKLSTT